MKKLLIADSSEEFSRTLETYLKGEYEIRICRQGKEALETICSFNPDLVVLDLFLPELEGISVLQQAADRGYRPLVLATTRHISDYIQEMMARLGVCYLMRKPCDLWATAARLRDLADGLGSTRSVKTDRILRASNTLLELSHIPKLDGYLYLRHAIPLAMELPNPRITKDIYPAVAREFSVSCQQVERSIARAIEKAHRRRDEKVWSRYFPREPDGMIACPSNGEFILAVANRLHLEETEGIM